MKLSDYTSRLASLSGVNRLLMLLLLASALSNLILALAVVTADNTERVIITPPILERSFWVQGEQVDSEYLTQMASWFTSLNLTYNPQSAPAQNELFLRYVHPLKHAALTTKANQQLDSIRRYRESSVFYVREIRVLGNKVALSGDLRRFVGERVLENRAATFRVDFRFDAGRMNVWDFMEVSADAVFDDVVAAASQ